MTTGISTEDRDLRAAAVKLLRKKREFWQHLFVYVVINTAIILVWAFTMPGHFFWPVFPLLGWGIGLVFHAFDVYRPQPTEDSIRREMDRLAGR